MAGYCAGDHNARLFPRSCVKYPFEKLAVIDTFYRLVFSKSVESSTNGVSDGLRAQATKEMNDMAYLPGPKV